MFSSTLSANLHMGNETIVEIELVKAHDGLEDYYRVCFKNPELTLFMDVPNTKRFLTALTNGLVDKNSKAS